MTREEIFDALDGEVQFYDDLDSAIIGIAERCGGPSVVCYDYNKTIQALMDGFEGVELDADDVLEGITLEEKKENMALEWMDFNILGGYIGELTPIILRTQI